MSNNKQSSVFVKTMIFVVLAITLTVGVTYAYFRANITGVESESTISVGGATLAIKYEGSNSITAQNVIPGWIDKKYFSVDVTNTSGKDIEYDIKLVVENNNFDTEETMNSWLEYGLFECNSAEDKVCDTYLAGDWIYTQSGDQLVYSVATNTSGKTYYALGILFPNLDEEQSQTGTDGNPLTFSGYVTLTSTKEVYVEPFTTDSWETIASNIQSGNGSRYKVGNEKEVEIDMNDDGIKESYTVRIANNSTPSECSTEGFSQTACGFVVEFVDIVEQRAMNEHTTNRGGWPATAMYQYVNGTYDSDTKKWNRTDTLYSKLPSDLQNAIIDTTVISGHGLSFKNPDREDGNFESTDKLYLLSTGEIWSDCTTRNCYDTASYPDNGSGAITTRQLDYYSNNNVSTSSYYNKAIKEFNGTAAMWWLRAANSVDDYSTLFWGVKQDGGKRGDYFATDDSLGVAPAFRIG